MAAATQAENQQNDVNSEKDQHISVRNSMLQNGTEKNSAVRGSSNSVVLPKGKNTGGKNLAIEMSQYRQDGSNSGGAATISAQNTSQSGGPCVQMTDQSGHGENESTPGSVPVAGPGPGPTDANIYPEGPPGPGDGYGFPYSRDVHNNEGVHAFGPRHSYGASKQTQQQTQSSVQNFSQSPQRFSAGPQMSQSAGPTPTLNQLLQSSNPMAQRYQNSYDQSYNQGWSQKPVGPYGSGVPTSSSPAAPYRTQSTMSPGYGVSTPSPGYGESRSGWPGHPTQHAPSSPGPPSSAASASQPSPQPSQQSHSPGPGSGLPPSPQHQGFPNRPAQPTTPNAHAPDAADLSGGNSNDSSGGPAPGTPNSQGLRPTPSPTGSTGSRSMSPAVGQQNIPMPPRPSSGPSDNSGGAGVGISSRISHSPIGTATPGSYPQGHPAHGAYKTHPGISPSASPNSQQMPLYQSNPQYTQQGGGSGYPPRPQQYPNQGYGPPQHTPPANNVISGQNYPNRSMPNHMSNSQFAPYQQGWGVTPPPTSKGGGNNLAAPPQAPGSPSPRPPNYLKHHLQHKMGFGSMPGAPPSPGPPQNYHMGPPAPGHHHGSGMGPPNTSMGPPNMPSGGNTLMPNSHPHEGPPMMPPPSSTPNSHSMPPDMMDNGITTTAQGGLGGVHVTASMTAGSVTSVVTTGPDGTAIDEGSQQSTLSNASAASGEDPQCTTPKASRKNDMGHYSHPTTPQSTVPSPGAASMNSLHEDYNELSSPSWPRTPASPVFNSHVPAPETYRSKKTDSLSKLYEMDDSPDRRAWLDKLLAFMDDRRTPITTCPTISKNPLDLFRLYVFVKDRGGFMEVTKSKTWKDIAGMLGIGASSSAAYTLRKHYTKNLLAYECQYDRGGIDPQPIINQVEASSKKKGAKATSIPSPGSSNSQDSFPPPGSGGGSMDGYGYNYPPGPNQDYNSAQRPSSQTNAPSPHAGAAGANHLNNAASGGSNPAGGGTGDNVSVSNPFDDVSPSPSRGGPYPGGQHQSYPAGAPPRPQGPNYTGGQSNYNQYQTPVAGAGGGAPPDQYSPYSSATGYPPAVRPVYPPYSGDNAPPQSAPGNTQAQPQSGAGTQDPYNRYNMPNQPAAGYSPRPAYGTPPAPAGPPASQTSGPSGPYPPQQEYYRSDQPGAPNSASYQGQKNMPPPGPQPPRRHPDFAKDQQQAYSQYGQTRPQMYNWPNNNQYRQPQYGTSGGPQAPPPGQQWNQGGRPPGQWERYPNPNQPYQQPPQQGPQQQWSSMSTPGVGQSSPLRTPPMGGPRPNAKPFNTMMPNQGGKGGPPQAAQGGGYSQGPVTKREITFPPDSVEATLPVIYRRKRLCRTDLGSVDAWRIIMSLRSGLLAESTYALDLLNVLLYDDTSVAYFGLSQWPSLLDLLLEHFRIGLSAMFGGPFERNGDPTDGDVDLGGVDEKALNAQIKTVLLNRTNNYSQVSRKGDPIKFIEREDDIFVTDHRRSWDVHGDANEANVLAEIENDSVDLYADHLLPPFQAEFGRIPFHMRFKDDEKLICDEGKDEPAEEEEEDDDEKPVNNSILEEAQQQPAFTKITERKRRTKTLNDVISRIKKDAADDDETVDVFSSSSSNPDNLTTAPVAGTTTTDVITTEVAETDADNVKTDEETTEVCEQEPSGHTNASVNGDLDDKGLQVRDPGSSFKRRRTSDYEDEAYSRDEASLMLLTESQDNVGKRCVCMANIVRSLTFVPGNEMEFAKSSTFLSLVGKLLLLHHAHPPRTQKTRNYDREEDADFADSCSSLQGETEWWWEFLMQIRENVLVSLSNIAGQIDVSQFSEAIARPLLDGLLHWAICPSATGQDPFPSAGQNSLLSPQRLALEALCKLCVTNSNVDLVIATPPFSRLERLCGVLTKHLCRSEDQVLREFSINLLHYLAAANSSMARIVASQTPCVSLLVAFIEQAEQSALSVANQHGISALRDNPDSMGTSLDMLRRAASTLVYLAQHPDNRPLLVQQESRLLALVMSQILDQQVALLLSKVLYQISRS